MVKGARLVWMHEVKKEKDKKKIKSKTKIKSNINYFLWFLWQPIILSLTEKF